MGLPHKAHGVALISLSLSLSALLPEGHVADECARIFHVFGPNSG
jgi:hypothetical protein